MRIVATPFLFILMLHFAFYTSAQTTSYNSAVTGGEYLYEKNSASNPCITAQQYAEIETRCNTNSALYIHSDAEKSSASTVTLSWPLQAASGFTDCSYYFISAHVDQDAATTTFSDYNCGSIAYDGHKGTDIAIWPFPFYKMDNDQVEVIAAAEGTIIDKHDGEYDRNCVGVGSGLIANYVVVQQSDGSRALYWHMKKNSLTTKTIGQTVTAGEFIGIVGSSGSSSGPHLHFEVWAGSTNATINDPFSGICNTLNANSWWTAQKPYTEPQVLKASVHTTDLSAPPCPTTETLNESTSYTLPFQGAGLSPGYAKFYIFLRNETAGTTVDMSILNPNSTVFNSWSHSCTTDYNASYWGYSKLLPTLPGTYTFQATYNGITCSQSFDVVVPSAILEIGNDLYGLNIYQDRDNNLVQIYLKDKFKKLNQLIILNELGQQIYKDQINFNATTIDVTDYASGIYFVQALTTDNKIFNQKLMIAK